MNRIVTFDNMRALCVLWIVGFWHMMGYWQPCYQLNQSNDDICQIITWTALAAFTYISGYFLGHKHISSIKDVADFYIKRLKRFYILFFGSCTTLLIAGIILSQNGHGQLWFPETSDYLLSIIGLSTYIGNPPATIWYFCMLISFYLVTPLFLLKESVLYRIIIGIVLYIILLLLETVFGSDSRNCLYFPFYVFGILRVFRPEKIKISIYLLSVILFCIICSYQAINGIIDSTYFIIGESVFGIIWLLGLSHLVFLHTGKLNNYLAWIGYASMSAYLFHRQICGLFKVVLPTNFVNPWTTTFIYIPVIFICGYSIQKLYDSIIK